MKIDDTFRKARKTVRLSQGAVAYLSKTSLPTIQNIESGKGNPSLSVLSSVAQVLGLEISIQSRKPDWDFLRSCGVPIQGMNESKNKKPEVDPLVLETKLALQGPLSTREAEALTAFLLAIQIHYPTLYKKSFSKNPLALKALEQPITGRIIKLSRIARHSISEYL